MDMREFPASFDRTAIVLPLVIGVATCLPAYFSGIHWFLLVPVLLIAGTAAFSVTGYTVGASSIVVHRRLGEVSISLDGLIEARRAVSGDFAGAIRLWGNGGMFGYYGLYRTSKLGVSRWYVTNRSNTVVVITRDRTSLVSPDDPDGFLAALPAPTHTGPPSPAEPMRAAFPRWAMLAGILYAAAVGLVIAWGFRYSPGPPPTTITADSLTIQDRFYKLTVPRRSVYLGGVRVVDIREDAEWRPVGRTNGFSNGHYHLGWFRLENGQKAAMYWTTGTRLVVLPRLGGDPPVLLERPNPDAFIAQLKETWR